MPKLNNWYIHGNPVPEHVQNDPYTAPEMKQPSIHLSGFVTGHTGFNDGDHITTSPIVRMTRDGNVCTASGTEYELGDVMEEYEKLYPNARERLGVAVHQAIRSTTYGSLG